MVPWKPNTVSVRSKPAERPPDVSTVDSEPVRKSKFGPVAPVAPVAPCGPSIDKLKDCDLISVTEFSMLIE